MRRPSHNLCVIYIIHSIDELNCIAIEGEQWGCRSAAAAFVLPELLVFGALLLSVLSVGSGAFNELQSERGLSVPSNERAARSLGTERLREDDLHEDGHRRGDASQRRGTLLFTPFTVSIYK